MHKYIPVFLIVLALSFSNAVAQNKEGANWMFGTKFHLNFNQQKPAVSTYSFIDSTATGVASISDKNGNLLFFSSGGHVSTRLKVNGEYQQMPNGDLTGVLYRYKETFAEMIVQSPSDPDLYYLFFIGVGDPSAFGGFWLFNVQIDMRLNNGYGDVVPNSLQIVRKHVSMMKLTAMLHSNNRDTWILSQAVSYNSGNDSIVANLLTPNGVMPAVVTKAPKLLGTSGRMKASPNSESFVLFSYTNSVSQRALELFDFDRSTGIPTHKFTFPDPDVLHSMSSLAFSPDGSKLYVGTASSFGEPKKAMIYQFDLAAGNAAQVQQSRNVVYQTTDYYSVRDLQLAIDGKLYIIIDPYFFINGNYSHNNRYLATISCPNFYGTACRFKLQGLDLTMVNPGMSLPALNQTIFRNAGKLQAQAYRDTICAGDTVQLSAYGAGAEQFKWEPANGLSPSSDTLANPVVRPTVTTTYKVIGSSVCHSDTAFVTVTVLYKIQGITFSGPLQVASLSEQEYSVQNPAPGSSFYWHVTGGAIASGQGTSSIKVNWGAAGEGVVSVFEDPETGCDTETVSLKVQLTEGPEPVIYNVFTPDNDGRNDAFVIENLKWYAENELKIYNRWGVEVYKTSNYQNTWKAENVSAGVYYYLFTAKGKSWKGWVEVVK